MAIFDDEVVVIGFRPRWCKNSQRAVFRAFLSPIISAFKTFNAGDDSPLRHTRHVVTLPSFFPNALTARLSPPRTVFSTDCGMRAMPVPDATHATIAWYELNSSTRSGT